MDRAQLVKLLANPGLGSSLKEVDSILIKSTAQSGPLGPLLLRLIKRPGKRLRPMLLFICANASGSRVGKRHLQAAAAIESLHLASLAHDWIIDRQAADIADSDLLLAGDYLLAAGLLSAAAVSLSFSQHLAQVVIKMAAGQKMQSLAKYGANINSPFYLETITNKTAVLFEAAGLFGGELSNAGTAQAEQLAEFGSLFGKLFQIIDDLSDSEFTPKNRPGALAAAEQYAHLAAGCLNKLPDSQSKAALVKLPEAYLNARLS